MKKTTITRAAYDRLDGPGLQRLRASPKAATIRAATLADQAAATASPAPGPD